MEIQFEQILASVGDKGRYQKLLLWVYYISGSFVIPWMPMVAIFLTTVPDHWCYVNGRPTNVSLEEWKQRTIPWEDVQGVRQLSKCKQYKVPTNHSQEIEPKIIECQNGWQYDKTWYEETLSTRNNWVCQDGDKMASWMSVGLFGKFVGIIISNRLSDIFGRKIIFTCLMQLFGVFSLLQIYFTSGWMGYLVRFMSMVPFPAVIQIGLVLVIEQINNSWRPHATAIFFGTWVASSCLLSLLAWVARSWIWLIVITSSPFFLFIFYWPFVQESPRWLISQGKIDESAKCLRKIAEINGIDPPKDLENQLMAYSQSKDNPQNSIVDFLKSKTLMKLAFFLTVCWSCNYLVYYTLNYNVHNLSGNQFVNFFLLCIVEFPATVIAWITSQTLGRRLTQVFAFSLVVISTSIPIFLNNTQGTETVVCVLLTRILINVSFYAFYLQMLEIYPTSHRPTLMGLSVAIVLAFNILTPYIAYSSAYWSRMPYLIMAILGFVGCCLSLFIPETIGHKLPQTVIDSKELYANWPFWRYKGRSPADWKNILLSVCANEKQF